MRHFLSILLALLPFAALQAQTADEIIDRHLAAIGGADNWKKVNSLVTTGRINVEGAEVDIVLTSVHNKAQRQDIAVLGISGYSIVTQDAGWYYFPFQGQAKPEAMSREQLEANKEGLDLQGDFVDYKAKGHAIEYKGLETLEGRSCHKLVLTRKSGSAKTIYIDAATNLVTRTVSTKRLNGKEEAVVVNFSDYRQLPEGIVLPMRFNAGVGILNVVGIKVNESLKEDVFKPQF